MKVDTSTALWLTLLTSTLYVASSPQSCAPCEIGKGLCMSVLILCHAYGDVPDAPAISIECKKKEDSKHRNKEFFRILYNGNDVLLMFLER
jgi:hypothetical protein